MKTEYLSGKSTQYWRALREHEVLPPLGVTICLLGLLLAIYATVYVMAPPLLADLPQIEALSPTSAPQPVASPGLSPYWTPEVRRWGTLITKWATQYSIDPDLIASVVWHESSGNPGNPARLHTPGPGVSSAGAVGLMQIMPDPNYIRPDLAIAGRPTPEELTIPDFNIGTGVHILASLIQRNNGDVEKSLAEYNCGIRGASDDKCGRVYARNIVSMWKVAVAVEEGS